jgi:hypothetical protein
MKTAEKKEPYAKIEEHKEEHDRSMNDNKKKRFRIIRWLVFLLLLAVAAAYIMDYYPADAVALRAMTTDTDVTVKQTDYGWIFDGPSEENALIFYPGGNVEHTAYFPLLAACASKGIMSILCKMPLDLAVLKINAAKGIKKQFPEIENWYMAGHSLGGAMAAIYASWNINDFKGLILVASYSTANLSNSNLKVMSIIGTEDKVVNARRNKKYKKNLPKNLIDIIIEGGNHSYFGMYGIMRNDGQPKISNIEQIEFTAGKISEFVE